MSDDIDYIVYIRISKILCSNASTLLIHNNSIAANVSWKLR